MYTSDRRFDIPYSLIEATVVEPEMIVKKKENNTTEVNVETRLEFFRNGRRIIAKRQYDITSPEDVEGLREHLIDLGIEQFDQDQVLEALSKLPGIKVTAAMFFDSDGAVDHYLICNSLEEERVMAAIYPPEELEENEY